MTSVPELFTFMPTIVSRVLDGGRCLLDDLFKCQLLNLNQTSSRKPGVIVKEVLVIERHLDFVFSFEK